MEPSKLEGPTGLKQTEFWVNTRELYRRIEVLESALKVISTWASFDASKKHNRLALVPVDVVALCDKVLKNGEAR